MQSRKNNYLYCRLWVDVCKYHLQDKAQKCLRDPNAFKNFINEISSQAEQIRNRGLSPTQSTSFTMIRLT
ncbi:hypothetical protein Aduo_005225 [Ancylostoma duodenale]